MASKESKTNKKNSQGIATQASKKNSLNTFLTSSSKLKSSGNILWESTNNTYIFITFYLNFSQLNWLLFINQIMNPFEKLRRAVEKVTLEYEIP